MAVAFQEDFEAVQNMAKETIFKEPKSVEKTEAGEDGGSDGGPGDNGEDEGGNGAGVGGDDDELIDNDRESRKQLKSPLECGFVQTTTKPSVFFKILTDQDVEDRKKARQEKLHRAAVEIAQLEARRCAEEKHRLKRRELEQKERRLRALIMDELRSLWKKGHVFQIPEQVDPYLRGECGSDPEENEIRRRLFHGCFYEFCHRLQSSRKRFKHNRRTILETVTWTAQEVKLYYECMARHRIPIAYGAPAFAGPHCSTQRLMSGAHRPPPHEIAALRDRMPAYGTARNSMPGPPTIIAEHQHPPRFGGMYDWHGRANALSVPARAPGTEEGVTSFREPSKVSTNGNSNNSTSNGSSDSNDKGGTTKLLKESRTPEFEFVDELLKENVAVDSSFKPDSVTEIDLYDDL